MRPLKSGGSKYATATIGTALLAFLYLISRQNYLLFHSIAEVFSIVIAFCIFIIAWNSRRLMENGYLLFLGIAYLFIGGLDLIHTLAYAGMGVFPGPTTNMATQLWVAARFTESISLLLAPLFLGRMFRASIVVMVYTVVSLVFIGSIFFWNVFPVCFIEGSGLTLFKKVSEYAISLALVGAVMGLRSKRRHFEGNVLRLLIASILITIASELAFTFYIDAYGFSNLLGHYMKIVSFYLIYKALIETGLRKPYDLLFRELRQRELALRDSEEAYRSIFENTGTATLIAEVDTTISLVNTGFEKLSGYRAHEIEGRMSWTEFVAQDELERMREYHDMRRVDPEEAPREYDCKFIDRHGKVKDIHLTVSMIPGTDRSIASATDITDLKHAQDIIRRDKETLAEMVLQRSKELVEARERLAEARRLSGIGLLAATVAHELRSPLGVMKMAVMNIRRKTADATLESHLANIEKKISASDEIIGDLLRYSRIRPPNHERIDLHRILKECVENAATRFPGQKTTVTADLEAIVDQPIEADAVQITEVFDNVLNNAYQAMGDEDGRIEVYASVDEGTVTLEIRDGGPGIEDENLAMIFEPFFTTKARGTGLGLTVCRELVRLHGGDISVASEVGRGTLVVVTLPLRETRPGLPVQ